MNGYLYKILLIVFIMAGFISAQKAVIEFGIRIIRDKESFTAKLNDRLKKNDHLQISWYPHQDSYLYIVHLTEKDAELLHSSEILKNKLAYFPSKNNFIEVDGESSSEEFYVVVDVNKNFEIEDLFSAGKVKLDRWDSFKEDNNISNNLIVEEDIDDNVSIGGTVRGSKDMELKKFTGNKSIVFHYQFNVKK